MIKVLFDHQIFSQQVYGGISRYFANIIKMGTAIAGIKVIPGLLHSKNYYFKKEQFTFKEMLFMKFKKRKAGIYQKNEAYSKYLLKQNDFDVFHPTYFDPYFIPYLKKPLVVTIHDMTYEVLPQYFPIDDPTPAQKKIVAQHADKIIAISETTKQDIVKYLHIPEDKIVVIPHGIDAISPIYEAVDALPKRYLLYVGSRNVYKNFLFFAQAFKEIIETNDDLYLVLAGGGHLTVEENEYFQQQGIQEKITHISATDAQLNTLYKNALCFVFPSLYEGFGFPILEAFKNNCPVLLSNCSCFPEIAGDAALYFEADDLQSLICKLMHLLTDEDTRILITKKGKERLQNYTLEKCITSTANVYKELKH